MSLGLLVQQIPTTEHQVMDDHDFQGHVGAVDDTPEKRLGSGTVTHDGVTVTPVA